MNFDFTALESFLSRLYRVRKFYDLNDLGQLGDIQNETLFDFANQTFLRFNKVEGELEKNRIYCSTQMQQQNLELYYFFRLEEAIDYFMKVLVIASDKGKKKILDSSTNKQVINPDYRPLNFMSRDQFLEIDISYGVVQKKIDSINPFREIKPIILPNGETLGAKHKETKKLKWLGNVETFGYIFGQLLKGGYLDLPGSEGAGSVSKIAKQLLEVFELPSTKRNRGVQTSKDNLEKALSIARNGLRSDAKEKIKIPPANKLIIPPLDEL